MAEASRLARIEAKRAPIEEYVSEGVIPFAPEPDDEGRINVKIEGHDNVVRALQMNEQANRERAEHMDSRYASRTDMIEANDERAARKRHTPRASIVVPEMPWKRKKSRKRTED